MLLYAICFVINTALTFVIAAGLFRGHPGMTEVYGTDSPARRILACLYLTIGLVSLYALLQMLVGNGGIALAVAATLFPLQIIYKVMTAIALRPTHPVVLANLGVSALLALALWLG